MDTLEMPLKKEVLPGSYLVFSTNISSKRKVQKVKNKLDEHLDILSWNVDLQDEDKTLRIAPLNELNEQDVVRYLNSFGIYCEPLQ